MLFGNMRHRTETKRHTGNALKLSLHFGRFVLLTAIWVSFITVSSHAANDLTGEAQHTGTPRLSKEHVPPVKSCPDKHGPGPDYKDFSGQVLQEYQNSLIRDVVNHNTFDQCPSYYSDPLTRVTGYCYPPLSKDISQSIKEMIPRMQGSEQQLNNLEAEEEKKGKKRWGKAWEERKKNVTWHIFPRQHDRNARRHLHIRGRNSI